tara:strand:- start:1211 stop:1453 length:243 start_codon:yes stop_codon:yes gene_type:complete
MNLIKGIVVIGLGYYVYQMYQATATTPMSNLGITELGGAGPAPLPLHKYEGNNPITWEPANPLLDRTSVMNRIRGGAFGL